MNKMYNEMQGIKTEMQGIKTEVQGIKTDVKDVKGRVINIENDHGKKLNMLFDGYKQNAEKLDRIEKQVSKQEEFILKRVK